MQTLTSSELAFLATLRHAELTDRVLRLYRDGRCLFGGILSQHLNLMWNAYVQFCLDRRRSGLSKPSHEEVAAKLAEAVQASSRMPAELKDKCDGMLQKYLASDVPDIKTGMRLIMSLAELDGQRRLAAKLSSNAGLLELQSSLEATRRTLDNLNPDAQESQDDVGIVFNPLRDIEKLARRTVRVPTGINWMDTVSSGGGRSGELWLILGPPGGGKSTIAVQYACAQAMNSNDTLWATYEQSLEGDLAERMIANITDTSLDRIRDVGFENLAPEIKDRFWSSVAGVDDRLVALDMTKMKPSADDPSDYGGVQTIWNKVRELKAAGKAPKTLLLDWFGAMMSRIAANTGMDLSKCYRFKAQEEINLLIQMAKQEDMLVIVFHQLDVKAADSRPTFLANATHAQDMHNMQNFFDLVFVIGTRDVNDINYFSAAKARKGNRVTVTLHLIGDRSRFEMEEGWLPNRDGNFYNPGKTQEESSGPARGHSARSYMRELD